MNKPDLAKIKDIISNWDIRERILATLIYFDMFQLSLGEDDFWHLLLGKKESSETLRSELDKMGDLVARKGGLTALKGREDLLLKHSISKRSSYEMCHKVQRWSWLFRFVPYVELVAVCNYLPLGVVEEDSDIDLFVVTKANRIFIARVLLTLILQLFGLRRHGNKIGRRFCLSFYVSEEALDMKEILENNDIYFAYWMVALWPVYGNSALWDKLQLLNRHWRSEYLEGGRTIIKKFSAGRSIIRGLLERLLGGKFGNALEAKLRRYFQKRHALRKDLPDNASIIIDEKRLKFHNNDRRRYYREKWLRRLEGFGLL